MGAYEYYRNYCVCPGEEFVLGMRDLDDNEVSFWPVIVYNVNQIPIGVAATKNQYINVWNGDADNNIIGVLQNSNAGPFSFTLVINPGQPVPPWVLGETYDRDFEGIYDEFYASEYE
jgi:hypothetical protein